VVRVSQDLRGLRVLPALKDVTEFLDIRERKGTGAKLDSLGQPETRGRWESPDLQEMMEYRVIQVSQVTGGLLDTMVATGQEESLVKQADLDSMACWESPENPAERGRRVNRSSLQPIGGVSGVLPDSPVVLVFRVYLEVLDRWAPGVLQEPMARPAGPGPQDLQDQR
ncbi:hypothetical protein scyTo_0022213, partial [Scyliorhinus torazame]|nr:hypothetical protein [Scyliorhinus torazame]